MARNEVRIIGGMWKGRKIAFDDRPGLRPTLGRVRETLFNWLAADVADSHCLDLFAGSGALGLEAASRGASGVTLVDNHRPVARRLREAVQTLAADNVTVVCSPAERLLAAPGGGWDIVFVDPPFDAGLLAPILHQLAVGDALTAGGLVYAETNRRGPWPPVGWQVVRQSQAGDTRFGLLARP